MLEIFYCQKYWRLTITTKKITEKKIKNLKDLFNQYINHLKIYSPFVTYNFKNNNNRIQHKQEKIESIKKDEINFDVIKEDLTKNRNNIDSFYEDSSLFNLSNNMNSIDFTINNNNSFSFLYNDKEKYLIK